MRKVVLTISLLLVTIGNVQDAEPDKLAIKKGTWNVGSNFSIGLLKNERSITSQGRTRGFEEFYVSIFPNIGYAKGENLITGLSIGFGRGTSEEYVVSEGTVEAMNNSDYTVWTMSPYISRFLPMGKKAALYAQVEFGYSRRTSKVINRDNTRPISEGRTNRFFVGIRPGLTCFMTKRLALETRLGFLGYTRNQNSFKSDPGTFDNTGESSNLNTS